VARRGPLASRQRGDHGRARRPPPSEATERRSARAGPGRLAPRTTQVADDAALVTSGADRLIVCLEGSHGLLRIPRSVAWLPELRHRPSGGLRKPVGHLLNRGQREPRWPNAVDGTRVPNEESARPEPV